MSAISDFSVKLQAYFDRQDAAISGISSDLQFLKDQLTAIQNSPGPISTEDQASLDAALTRMQATSDKLDALDALTPPAAPQG